MQAAMPGRNELARQGLDGGPAPGQACRTPPTKAYKYTAGFAHKRAMYQNETILCGGGRLAFRLLNLFSRMLSSRSGLYDV
jgi:hypothetical protein